MGVGPDGPSPGHDIRHWAGWAGTRAAQRLPYSKRSFSQPNVLILISAMLLVPRL